jgi:hypothetical protein
MLPSCRASSAAIAEGRHFPHPFPPATRYFSGMGAAAAAARLTVEVGPQWLPSVVEAGEAAASRRT